ncbi:MAG TPA: type II toxin-antitoxin system VapC family toxin [Stellaceae bacterium]
MRLLLDTHALIWALADPPALGESTRDAILDPSNDVLVSIVSLWEIALKRRIGKLKGKDAEQIAAASRAAGFAFLSIESRHLSRLEAMPVDPHHRDPYDHLLAAQVLADDLSFVTNDRRMNFYGVNTVTCSG